MHNRLRCLIAAAAFLATAGCMNNGAAARGRISHLQPIEVAPGPNQIPLFVADGRSGLVTEGWRDLGGSVGYRVYSVMLPNTNPARGWDIVPLEPSEVNGHEALQISGSVRFARGWLDGTPTTLLITARRDPEAGNDPVRPAKMVLDTYQLITARQGAVSENVFAPVMTMRSSRDYCSPDLAIAHEFDLALPATYAGRTKDGGCAGGV